MVQTTVRPVVAMLRMARTTMEAARASSPEVGSLQREVSKQGLPW